MRVVLLNSGGKDSLAAAMVLNWIGHEIYSLHIDAGHEAPEHLEAAKRVADAYCVAHDVLTLRLESGESLAAGDSGFWAQRSLLPVLGLLGFRGVEAVAAGYTQHLEGRDFEAVASGYFAETWRFGRTGFHPPKLLLPLLSLSDSQLHDILKFDPMWRALPSCRAVPACGRCFKCETKAKFIAWGMR